MKCIRLFASVAVLAASAAAAWAFGIGGTFDQLVTDLTNAKAGLSTADQKRIDNAVKALQGPSDDVVVTPSTKNLKLAVLRLGKLVASDPAVGTPIATKVDYFYALVSGRGTQAVGAVGQWGNAHDVIHNRGNAAHLAKGDLTVGKALAANKKVQDDPKSTPAKKIAADLKANLIFDKIIKQYATSTM